MTEARNPRTTHIDRCETIEMLQLINEENMHSVLAVDRALPSIAKAVDAAAAALAAGGRILYIGAGTSGRLAVCDAAECPPTFGVPYETVQAIIAGGEGAITRAAENGEDNEEQGRAELLKRNPTANDIVIGISASGGAPFVAAALEEAKKIGCTTVSIASNHPTRLSGIADIAVWTDTGAEVVTGSTRMKAGNAQKMVLNMISTCAMIRMGHVYENLMINLRPTNQKLRKRVISIVCDILGTDAQTAEGMLEENNWNIRQTVEK